MRSFILIILCLLSLKFAHAQTGVYISDIQGKPIIEKTVKNVSGSPFLSEAFILGSVTVKDGFTYDFVPLKFNAITNELFFKDSKSEAILEFIEPVKSFKLGLSNYENGFPEIDQFNKSSFYEVIYSGKVKLLFKLSKVVNEFKPYNSATTERKYEDIKAYYLFKEGRMLRFKPSKKDLLEVFSDNSVELDAYIKKEKIDFKSNNDIAKLFEYYNSL